MILLDDATPKPDGIFGKDRGTGDGGSNRSSGDVAVVGSHDLSARTAGGSARLDYRLAPGTVVGFPRLHFFRARHLRV